MTILKTIIVASALITSSAAFADNNTDSLSRAVAESRVSFALNSTVNQPVENSAQLQRGATNRILTNSATFPVNTTTVPQGSNN
jgi:hypothetical protein